MKSVRLINHNFHKVCDVKAFIFFTKIKKQDNQTAFAGSEKKSFKSGRNAMLHTVQLLA